jgi:hypothetical protein
MPGQATASPSDRLAALRAQRIGAARVAPNAFCELVLRDEQTGAPVRQAPMHREWHRLADEHARLVLLAHVESGKTQNLSIGRTLFELGRSPTLRCAVISNTHAQAVKIGRAIASYVERSAELHAVFPDLRPDPGGPWNETQLSVVRQVISKDPSIQCAGVHGNVTGSRIDLLLIDDIVDYENSRLGQGRADLVAWLDSTLLGRLTARGRVICVGTAFHPEDALHVFQARGWPTFRYPVEDETGAPRWPQRWTPERIADKRVELGPAESARQLDVEVRDDASATIKLEWLENAITRGAKATALSRSDRGEPFLLHAGPGKVIVGVDLAVSKKATADLSAIVVILIHADKSRELLAVESGRWHGPEIIDHIINAHRRFMAGTVVVESNAAQSYISHWLREASDVPVLPFTTGRGQASLQWRVERIATELARGQWRIPSINGRVRDRETALLVKDLLHYSPAAHCPDRVSALAMAQYGCEVGERRAEVGRLDLMRR